MASRKIRGGVSWHLPNGKGGFKARAFAHSPTGTKYLIEVVAENGATWGQVVEAIIYCPEARNIAQAFVDAGFGDVAAAEHLNLSTTLQEA